MATIIGFIPSKWYYLGCKSCNTKIEDSSANQQCPNCPNEKTKPTNKYRLICKVKDTTGDTTILMFNKQALALVGVPVQHILTQMR